MKIVILGMGSTALSIVDILLREHDYTISGFIGTQEEDKKFSGKKIYRDIPFLGDRSILKDLKKQDVHGFVAAMGDRYIREEAFFEASSFELRAINAISKNSFIENNVKIGNGVIISSGCVVQHGVQIGNNCIIESGAIIDYEAKINENCNIDAGCLIGSQTIIEKNSSVGARSIILKNIQIGKHQSIEVNAMVKSNLKGLTRPKK